MEICSTRLTESGACVEVTIGLHPSPCSMLLVRGKDDTPADKPLVVHTSTKYLIHFQLHMKVMIHGVEALHLHRQREIQLSAAS